MGIRSEVGGLVVLLAASLMGPGIACGQAGGGPIGGAGGGSSFSPQDESSLGRTPGGGGNLFGEAPGSDRPVLGGGLGTAPIVPPSISTPGGGGFQNLGGAGVGLMPRVPEPTLPLYGPLALPDVQDAGPPAGLTLDQAIRALIRNNLDLRSRFYEIPQARADVLTAGLYANPLFFADAQLVPYGNYSERQPGGPTQYDINISHPVDLTGKVRAREAVAVRALEVIEAQYQDAVRVEIGNLYEAYLGALLARETVEFSRAALVGLDRFLETVRDRMEEELATQTDVNQVVIQRELAAIGFNDAIETERASKIRLGALLGMPPAHAERLQLRGTLFPTGVPDPPLGDALVRLALESRPDLAAFRLGVLRSEADVTLAEANRLDDVYVLFQPFTYQDNDVAAGGGDPRGSYSWALGLTVPLPVYNRNQGNIQRAKLNVGQSKSELAAQELRIVSQVKQTEKEYVVARAGAERLKGVVLPAAQQVLGTAYTRFRAGEQDILYYLTARRNYNDFVRQYLATWLRFRRSQLSLNTAVGRRVQP